MGGKKNNPGSQLGRAIIKDRFGKGRGRNRRGDPTMVHTAELEDGYDWGRLNLQSVTEQSQLDEFLATAELAGTEFTAEKMNITFVKPQTTYGLLTKDEKIKVKSAQDAHLQHLKIPRRPHWDRTTSGEELQQMEREAFMNWRRGLSELQEVDGITMTPYEKNLEFWRQLWRVIERSDVVVQIVDARNPLLFRCEDLERYVHEVSKEKKNMILINKADFLSERQRKHWVDYFNKIELSVAFFSALQENQNNLLRNLKIDEDEEFEEELEEASDEYSEESHEEEVSEAEDTDTDVMRNIPKSNVTNQEQNDSENVIENPNASIPSASSGGVQNSTKLLSREELLTLLKTIHEGLKVQEGRTVVGLVGYPNVGKSSTINSLLSHKKVSVSATPGKTKHFQTLIIDDELTLCDCPGLVMPSFVSTKHEMVIWGILPIDQMRDHVGPMNLVGSLIPRFALEATYGIFIPKPGEGEDPQRAPSSEEILNAYGFMRGFMTARGLPDNPRSARHILKDFVQGKLLYCTPPPEVDPNEFEEYELLKSKLTKTSAAPTPFQLRVTKTNFTSAQSIDQAFFAQSASTAHSKGRASLPGSKHTQGVAEHPDFKGSVVSLEAGLKPSKKHNKRPKREKLRRVYAYLDQ